MGISQLQTKGTQKKGIFKDGTFMINPTTNNGTIQTDRRGYSYTTSANTNMLVIPFTDTSSTFFIKVSIYRLDSYGGYLGTGIYNYMPGSSQTNAQNITVHSSSGNSIAGPYGYLVYGLEGCTNIVLRSSPYGNVKVWLDSIGSEKTTWGGHSSLRFLARIKSLFEKGGSLLWD